MQELSKKLVIISCFCYSVKPNCGGRHRNNNLILVHTFCVQILLKYLFRTDTLKYVSLSQLAVIHPSLNRKHCLPV